MRAWPCVLLSLLPLAAAATVNVNTAQQSELQRTRGLDKQKAKAIIEYRAQHGRIDSMEALERAIGHEAVEKARPQIAFSGPAFVPDKGAAAEKAKPAPKKAEG